MEIQNCFALLIFVLFPVLRIILFNSSKYTSWTLTYKIFLPVRIPNMLDLQKCLFKVTLLYFVSLYIYFN